MRLWKAETNANNYYAKYVNINDDKSRAVLHVFRALLRQCTYLPDPAARQYMHRHVVSRFRDYHPHTTLPYTSRQAKSVALVKKRLPKLLRDARKGLMVLRRANDGYVQHLGKVLAMTYGRIGKHRHQLLVKLKIPDIPVDQAALAELSKPANQAVPLPSKQLMALVKAQASRQLTQFSRSNTPRVKPDIPEKNSWGRPMPIKRVRNMKRRWYAEMLDRIMPPLPEAEWDNLYMRASGQSPWEGPVARRKWVGEPDDEAQGQMTGEKLETSLKEVRGNPHKITPRYMRRLWAKIFQVCPVMKPDETKKSGWEVLWGDIHDLGSTQFVLGIRGKGDGGSNMFEGVDEDGKVVAQG